MARQRRGVTPQMRGRYPDYDVLATAHLWDEPTRTVVLGRLDPPPVRFFDPDEAACATAFCNTVTAQDGGPRIPVMELVDHRMATGELDGFCYADLPDDRETWRLVLAGLDETARDRHGHRFADLDWPDREAVVADFADGKLTGGSFARLHPARAWSVVMRYVLGAFYSHPWAWTEIGFAGPAYPHGFMGLGPVSTREPYETPEASE